MQYGFIVGKAPRSVSPAGLPVPATWERQWWNKTQSKEQLGTGLVRKSFERLIEAGDSCQFNRSAGPAWIRRLSSLNVLVSQLPARLPSLRRSAWPTKLCAHARYNDTTWIHQDDKYKCPDTSQSLSSRPEITDEAQLFSMFLRKPRGPRFAKRDAKKRS